MRRDAPHGQFAKASGLFAANSTFLPSTNTRAPKIVRAGSAHTGVLTTADFEYDDTANTFHLKGKGDVCEMGDAVLGSVCASLGVAAPNYVAVRNVSDPEVDSSMRTPGTWPTTSTSTSGAGAASAARSCAGGSWPSSSASAGRRDLQQGEDRGDGVLAQVRGSLGVAGGHGVE